MKKRKYFTNLNERFGKWVVISPATELSVKNKSLVKCECGEEKLIGNNLLIRGLSKSCKNCETHFKDLSNIKFGFLIAEKISKTKIKNDGHKHWKCKCICGDYVIISSKHLLSGATKSCGCKTIELILKNKNILPGEQRATNKILKAYIKEAKNRNLIFDLTYDEFLLLIKQNCYYCNSNPDKTKIIKRTMDTIIFDYSGIDRKDNNSGYTKDNCVPCCWMCNKTKSALSFEEFIKWINKLKSHDIIINESTES